MPSMSRTKNIASAFFGTRPHRRIHKSTKILMILMAFTLCILFYQSAYTVVDEQDQVSLEMNDDDVDQILTETIMDDEDLGQSDDSEDEDRSAEASLELRRDRLQQSTTNTDVKNSSIPLPPVLYIITPTYKRPEQVAEITRLGHTLKHVPNLFWLVIEDAQLPTEQVTRQLHRLAVPFVHLTAPMPARYQKNKWKPQGISNRNRGLEWIRANANEGVFYFADDCNTYDLAIFDQMRYTKKVSMWPVGLVTNFGISSPIVRNGELSGFYDGWIGGRMYPVYMAGFAISVQFLLSRPKAIIPFIRGYEEDHFLKSLAPLNNTEIELLASNCTEILTWLTQTKKYPVTAKLDTQIYGGTNMEKLLQLIV